MAWKKIGEGLYQDTTTGAVGTLKKNSGGGLFVASETTRTNYQKEKMKTIIKGAKENTKHFKRMEQMSSIKRQKEDYHERWSIAQEEERILEKDLELYDKPREYEGDPTLLKGKHAMGREIHVPYEKYGGGYTGEKTTADYYTTKVYAEDKNSVSVLMPHKLGVTKRQLEDWTGTSINKMEAGDIVKVPYTMSGTYDDKNMYEHKLIKGGDYPEIETKIPLSMTKEQANKFESNYQKLKANSYERKYNNLNEVIADRDSKLNRYINSKTPLEKMTRQQLAEYIVDDQISRGIVKEANRTMQVQGRLKGMGAMKSMSKKELYLGAKDTQLAKMSLSELVKTAQKYNIDTKGLNAQQLRAKLIAIFK